MSDFSVTTSQFKDGASMPMTTVHTGGGGQNVSPDLAWSGAPSGTKSVALTMYDPDAPTTVGFVHWLLFNLPASLTHIGAGAGAAGKHPSGSVLGYTDWGASEYGGPLPPPVTRRTAIKSRSTRWTFRSSSSGRTRRTRTSASRSAGTCSERRSSPGASGARQRVQFVQDVM